MDLIRSIVFHPMIQHNFLIIIRNFTPKNASGLDAFMFNWGYDHNNYVFPPPALVGTVLQYAQKYQAKLTLVFLEWYSRPYMNVLFPQTGNPFLIDKVYVGYYSDILE